MDFLGEAYALLVAVSWTTSNFYFQHNKNFFQPMMLTFVKCSLASIVLLFIIYAFDFDLFPVSDSTPYLRLILSGFLGISFGDTFFFEALHELGARKTLMIETLAPPLTGLVAFIYYGTTISLLGWVGIGLILYGLFIAVVQSENDTHDTSPETKQELLLIRTSEDLNMIPEDQPLVSEGHLKVKNILRAVCSKGILCGAAAMLFQSIGIVLSSSVLTMGKFNPLCVTFIRIAPQNLVLFPVLKYYKKEKFTWPRLSLVNNLYLVTAILISAIIVIWFTQLSLVYTRPEITQTLIATSPLFGVLTSRLKGEQITTKQVIGSFVSVLGVVLIVLV